MYNENEIGKRVRSLRGDLSLRVFAEKCGISHTVLDTIEKGIDFRTGKPTQTKTTTLLKIAKASNVPLSYIVGEKESIFISYKDGDTGLRKELSDKIEAYKLKHPLEEISEGKNKLIDYVLNVPENKAEKVLKIIQAIVEDN